MRAWRLLFLGSFLAAPAMAQSLTATRGLGFVHDGWTAAARALGGEGGRTDPGASLRNPAFLVGVRAPLGMVTFEQDRVRATWRGERFAAAVARFPALQVVFPLHPRAAVGIGYRGWLDQTWAVERTDTLIVDSDTLPLRDRVASSGGVAALQLAGGWAPWQRLALGGGVEIYTGSTTRRVDREFAAPCGSFGQLAPACFEARYEYQGVGAVAGLRWVPLDPLAVALSARLGGTLRAVPQDTAGAERRFRLPLVVGGGASARLSPRWLANVSASWAQWSRAADGLDGADAVRDTWDVGVGLEWATTSGAGAWPVRLGARYAQLPFLRTTAFGATDPDRGALSETALALGTGRRFGGAELDLTAEWGRRSGTASLRESFFRWSASLQVQTR